MIIYANFVSEHRRRMERMMHYIWQHRLWDGHKLATVEGLPVKVIDTGKINRDSGPDFFNAKIEIGGQLWVGDVEMHVKASDWYRHGHQNDSAYSSVILHIVEMDDIGITNPSTGKSIPQMRLSYSRELEREFQRLSDAPMENLACSRIIADIPRLLLTDWISALAFERLNSKAQRIHHFLSLTTNNWEEAAYITLARALGSGTNGDAFQRLASSVPLRLLGKHSDSILAIESILFGQAGMLDEDIPDNQYYRRLKNEYEFMKNKFGLSRPTDLNWKMARMRPANFPHRRIALLASYIFGGFYLTRNLLEAKDVEEATELFRKNYSPYWQEHFSFSPIKTERHLGLGKTTLHSLVINVAVPLIYAYGLSHPGIKEGDKYRDKAVFFLESLESERNYIITLFKDHGITCPDALTSQALIQLRREYCEKKKCLYCRIGHRLLSQSRST